MTVSIWLSVAEAAALEAVTERRIRARIKTGELEASRRSDGGARAWCVSLWSLSPEAHARYFARNPETAPPAEEAHADSAGDRSTGEGRKSSLVFAAAAQPLRQRALLRREAVLAWRRTLAEARHCGRHIGQAQEAWLSRFRAAHSGFKVSIASVKRWDRAYRQSGNNLDSLVDGNDGSGRRGKTSIDPELEADFTASFLQPTRRKIRDCHREIEKIAEVRGLAKPSYSALRRVAAAIPPIVVAACRFEEDSSIRPWVPRDYNSLGSLDLVQSDHHQSDVAVHCGDPFCDRGHYPWVTGWIDVRSRKVLTFDILVGCPNSRSIVASFKRMILTHGKPNGVMIDNGLDFKKAMGWSVAFREWGRERAKLIAVDFDGPQVEHRLAPLGMRVVFALPYNAQSKLIERFWRTLVDQAWRQFPSYRGMLGQRSEEAERLRKNPQLLPTAGDLTLALERAVDEYNERPHSGHGMDDRSPNAVFEATHIPRVDVNPVTLSLVFYDSKELTLKNNGIQWKRHEWYRLDDVVAQAEWFDRKVRVRYDPENLSELVVTTLDGTFISLARHRERASYSSQDAKTRELIELKSHDWKAIKGFIREQNPAAGKRLEKIASTVEQYHALREQQRVIAASMPAAASGGGGIVVQVLPYESTLSRAITDARARVSNPSSLSAADLALARTVDAPSDQDLADFASQNTFAGVITPRAARGRPEADDDVPMAEVLSEMEARRLQRRAEEREREGMCGYDIECPNAAVDRGVCLTHYDQLFGV